MFHTKKEYENKYKSPFLFGEDIITFQDALIIAQNYWGDKKNGTPDWDSYCQFRIDKFERVLDIFNDSDWKDLPTPPDTKEK
jgi:hypothetical protein